MKTAFFDHKYVIFGPVGLLSKGSQQYYDYKILGEETLKKEKLIVVEATPKPDLIERPSHLFGKVWVKGDNFSIMKIEWNQVSMGNFEKIMEKAKSLKAEPRITFVSEYAFEKNGIRFPSKYYVLEEYLQPTQAKLTASETTVIYKNYKFFTVETKAKYK